MITVAFMRPAATQDGAVRRDPEFGSRRCPSYAGKRRNNKKRLWLANQRH